MKEGYWFTTIGMSPHAVLNTIWAAYEESRWQPVKIILFRLVPEEAKPGIKSKLDTAYEAFLKWLTVFQESYNLSIQLDTQICVEQDYATFFEKFKDVVKSHTDRPRAIDITPGRKFASAIGLRIGIAEKVDSIFYLHLLDDTYNNHEYPLIPHPSIRLVDFKEEVLT